MDPAPPLTAHPAYRGKHADLLPLIGRARPFDLVRVPEVLKQTATFKDAGADFPAEPLRWRERVLTVKMVVAPAPFVGEPFDYRWKVAVDELGRQVAGEAWLEPWDESRIGEWRLWGSGRYGPRHRHGEGRTANDV